MLSLEKIKTPTLLMEKDGQISLRSGKLIRLEQLDDLATLQASHPGDVVFVVPFCSARENGMAALGDQKTLVLLVEDETPVARSELNQITAKSEILFTQPFEPSMSDDAFAAAVEKIQHEEIAQGNACQVIFSRKFTGILKDHSAMTPLKLFSRLLEQPGQYLTFLFSDGNGHYFVGASPERQLEIRGENVIKNPISGTMPKGDIKDFPERLEAFIQDKKEMNELSQILDEELKIMSRICPRGGKITGPFLREAGAVIHTEYHLAGHSKIPAVQALKISLHAPTLVGSPLESAFRIIAKREGESRRYYGGEIGVLEKNGDMYSAILIRTAEIFSDGRIAIQAGAGIVRDSNPLKEARETQAKAAGLINALTGKTATTEKYLSQEMIAKVDEVLNERNASFSRFHLDDQIGHRDLSNLHQERITIINNEDNFAYVLSHITRYLGYETSIVDTFSYDVNNDLADLVVLGPGPGDINDDANPRMKRLLQITAELAHRNVPTLGICLGIQAMAKHMGMPVQRQAIPTQGLQLEIDLFGKKERVGMYNSFSPLAENVPDNFEVCVNSDNRIMALRSDNIYGFQFHVESAMTENGLGILTEALTKLMGVRERRVLSFESFIEKSISGELNLEAQKQFLLELNQRGFSGNDIADLVTIFYKQMPAHLEMPGAIDLCGTGGSGLARINTSTISAVLVAASGIPVAKHGNKAASGRFGSFDLLDALGLNISLKKHRLEFLYGELGLAFIFARSFHPVFKHFAHVRQELKVKTIFNLLGPLLNPANPTYQIIGTSNPDDMDLMIEAARALGKEKVLVLNGSDGLDELTLTGETTVMELKDGVITKYVLTPEDFGLKRVDFSEISGGDEAFNVKITRDILEGHCSSAHVELVLANVALVLKFMGKVNSYPQGVYRAKEIIQQGIAETMLQRYSQLSNAPDILLEITTHKRKEIASQKKQLSLTEIRNGLKSSERDFKAALGDRKSLSLIAEIKRSSPSENDIFKGDFSVETIATLYEQNGADAISVLTDEKYFNGSCENLRLARSATSTTPLLFKDFIVDEYQIYLARYYGADAILLIAAILTEQQINSYIAIAKGLNMDALLEVHTEGELKLALKSKATIIGINNRDLHTFQVNPKTFIHLLHRIPDSKIIVAESGYNSDNISMVQGLANAALVGSSIMRSSDMAKEIRMMKSNKKKMKACGIRNTYEAEHCEAQNIDFAGLNFVPSSKRVIDMETAKGIVAVLKNTCSVGIFQNQPLDDVNRIAGELGLDFVQLSGSESVEDCQKIAFPVIKTVKVTELDQLAAYGEVVQLFIIDGSLPGSGKGYHYAQLQGQLPDKPFLVAGGVSGENAASILEMLPLAAGLDVASGIETNGRVDTTRVTNIAQIIAGAL